MANRRMFSMDVIDTDKFLDMPTSTQALYFHLGMRADDDGFVSSPKRIANMVNCNIDDLKLLITKKYLIPFNDGVVVITDWKVNNWIRGDRKQETRFKNELSMLSVIDDSYQLSTSCQPTSNQMPTERHTQVRLGKDSIGKDNKKNICPEPDKPTPDPSGILMPLVDKTNYDVPLSKIAQWEETFPAVDVKQELLKMVSWLDENPARRKTRRGIGRFIHSWLSKEQDRGGVYRNGSRQQDKAEEQRRKEQEKETLKFYDDLYARYPTREPSPDDPFQ